MEKPKQTMNQMIKKMSRKRFYSLFSMLLIITVAFWGLIVWLFSPVPEPKTIKIQGTITNVIHISPVNNVGNAIQITVDGVVYRADDGAYRELNSKVDQITIGGYAVIRYFTDPTTTSKYVATLTVNDVELLSMKTYLKEERTYRSWIGGIITIFGIPLLVLTIYYPIARYRKGG